LSGNPVAMAAGLASVKKLKDDKSLYQKLESLAIRLTKGLKEAADREGIDLRVDVRGSMFGFFFNQNEVKNFDDALKCDTDRFAKFHQKMLQRGIYFACSQFETGFICASMDEAQIDSVIEAAREVFKEL
jgi:glutamate-1-semialdehyde 2,1-aminomutase